MNLFRNISLLLLYFFFAIAITGCYENKAPLKKVGPNPEITDSNYLVKYPVSIGIYLPPDEKVFSRSPSASTQFQSGCSYRFDMGAAIIQKAGNELSRVFSSVNYVSPATVNFLSYDFLAIITLTDFEWSGEGFGEPARAAAEIELKILRKNNEIFKSTVVREERSISGFSGSIWGGGSCGGHVSAIQEAVEKTISSSVKSAVVSLVIDPSFKRSVASIKPRPNVNEGTNNLEVLSDSIAGKYLLGSNKPQVTYLGALGSTSTDSNSALSMACLSQQSVCYAGCAGDSNCITSCSLKATACAAQAAAGISPASSQQQGGGSLMNALTEQNVRTNECIKLHPNNVDNVKRCVAGLEPLPETAIQSTPRQKATIQQPVQITPNQQAVANQPAQYSDQQALMRELAEQNKKQRNQIQQLNSQLHSQQENSPRSNPRSPYMRKYDNKRSSSRQASRNPQNNNSRSAPAPTPLPPNCVMTRDERVLNNIKITAYNKCGRDVYTNVCIRVDDYSPTKTRQITNLVRKGSSYVFSFFDPDESRYEYKYRYCEHQYGCDAPCP